MEIINKANNLIKGNKLGEAVKLLEKYPKMSEAAYMLYQIHGNDQNGSFYDSKKAMSILRSLYKTNYIPAIYSSALEYYMGINTEKDVMRSDEIFRKFIRSDSKIKTKYFSEWSSSCEYLAKIYENGEGGDLDKKEALRYYKKACENSKLIEASYKAGKLTMEVYPENYQDAINYLAPAVADNHVKAIRLVTKIYLKLAKKNLSDLTKLSPDSLDPVIILEKISSVDENIL